MAVVKLETEERWLTMGQAARLLGVDASSVRRWVDAGRLRAFRTPGGHRRIGHRRISETALRRLVEGDGSETT